MPPRPMPFRPSGPTAEEREEKRLYDLTEPYELVLNLEYLAKSFGMEGPVDFELGLSILGSNLIMRARRPKRSSR